MMHIDLSVIIVNWNTRDLLRQCLEMIPAAARDLSFEIIVVDNASTDGSQEMVRTFFPSARLLINQENLGFPKAVNQGIRCGSGEYLALVNTDVVIPAGALSDLVTYLRGHPHVGAAGPQLAYGDGRLQQSGGFAPSPASAFKYIFSKDSGILVRSRKSGRPMPVDWLCMACLVLPKRTVHQVGMLDESHFMYAEDMEYGLRLKKSGWPVHLLPNINVVHMFAASSSGIRQSHVLGLTAYFRVASGELSPSAYALFGILLSMAYGVRCAAFCLAGLASPSYRGRASLMSLYARTALKLGLHKPGYATDLCRQLESRLLKAQAESATD